MSTPTPRRILNASGKIKHGPAAAVDASKEKQKEKAKEKKEVEIEMLRLSLSQDMPAPLRTHRLQSTAKPGTSSREVPGGAESTTEAASFPTPLFASESLNAAIRSGALKVTGFSLSKPDFGPGSNNVLVGEEFFSSFRPQVTTPAINPTQNNLYATSEDEILPAHGPTKRSRPEASGKKHGYLNPTCEDAFDDTEANHPNVYNTADDIARPPTKRRTRKKKHKEANSKPEARIQFRDIPVSVIDLNPKSPKSPKTRQNPSVQALPTPTPAPVVTVPNPAVPALVGDVLAKAKERESQKVHHSNVSGPTVPNPTLPLAEDTVLLQEKQKKPKKKKKKPSNLKIKTEEKFVAPAIIRSPTLEEKQEKIMQTFMLYDNPFQKKYERIRAEVLAAGGEEVHADLAMGRGLAMRLPAGQDPTMLAELQKYGHLTYNPRFDPTSSEYEHVPLQAHSKLPAAWKMTDGHTNINREKKPITEFLQRKSNVKVDVRNAAVTKAQNFWDKPNEIWGEKGRDLKDLNSTFKAALDRAAGAKVNTMIFGGDRGVFDIEKGRIFASGVRAVARPAMQSKESQKDKELNEAITRSTFKTAEEVLTLHRAKENATAYEDSTPLMARMEKIKNQALTISYSPDELNFHLQVLFPKLAIDASWLTPSIISQIGTHPKLLQSQQPYSTSILTCTEHIISSIYPMFYMHDDSDASKIHIWVLWLNGCETLWRLIHESLLTQRYKGKYGLRRLKEIIFGQFNKVVEGLSDVRLWRSTLDILIIFTLWFIEEYHWTLGDFDLVVVSAEEVFPDEDSIVKARSHRAGTMHLAFPIRELAIQRTIEEAAESGYDEALVTEEDFEAKLVGYGSTVELVLQILDQVIDGVREVHSSDNGAEAEDEKLAIACFDKAAFALWNIIHQRSPHSEVFMRGIQRMCEAAFYAAVTDLISTNGKKIWLLRTLTLWFREQMIEKEGDLKAINTQVLKEVPNGDRDFDAFVQRENGTAEWKDVFAIEKVERKIIAVKATIPKVQSKPILQTPSDRKALQDNHKEPPPNVAATPASVSKSRQISTQGEAATPSKRMNITDFGHNIPQVIENIDRIISTITSALSDTTSRKAADLEFMNCSYALWYHVRKAINTGPPSASKSIIKIESESRSKSKLFTSGSDGKPVPVTGLKFMCRRALTCRDDKSMMDVEKVKLMMRLTLWFVVRWRLAGEGLGKVEEEALKEFPTGGESWDGFPRVGLTELKPKIIESGAWKDAKLLDGTRAGDVGVVKDYRKEKKAKENMAVQEAVKEAVANLQKGVKNNGKAISEAKCEVPMLKSRETIVEGDSFRIQKVAEDSSHPGPEAKCQVPILEGQATVEEAVKTAMVNLQKVVQSNATIPEAKCEVPTVKRQVVTGEEDDFDQSHESMEYISPSKISGNPNPATSEGISVEVNRRKVNAVIASNQRKLSASTTSGSDNLQDLAEKEKAPSASTNIDNIETSKQVNKQDTEIKVEDEHEMSNNTVPPTPPMTYEEFSAQPDQEIDMQAIHNTLTTLSLTFEQVGVALYGTPITPTHNNTGVTDTDSHTTGLLHTTNNVVTTLRDAQTQIASVESKISALSNAIANLHTDNAQLKTSFQALLEKMDHREEKDIQTQHEGQELLRQLLDEIRNLKKDIEVLNHKDVFGDEDKRKWMQKAEELNLVVERAREVGSLSEVLWPQGDGYVGDERASSEVKSEGAGVGEGEKKMKRELYVKVGHRAGRGQGGGGFCAVM